MLVKRPHITEKSLLLVENQNKYTFEVALDANKIEATKEIESTFGVKVEGVRTHTRLGKVKRFGRLRKPGKQVDRKYMIFKLKDGDKIDLFVSK